MDSPNTMPFELNADNYYSNDADKLYMSCSQYQEFLKCEAAAMAKIHGLYIPKKSEALIVGNYFHTALESDEAHERFCEENFEDIFKYKVDKKTGEAVITGKYAAFEKADVMLDVMKRDPLITSLVKMPGENEVIMTGKLFGTLWKIRLDKYNAATRFIVDWKTAADLMKTEYNPATGERESFMEALGYLMRAAIYTEIEKQYSKSDSDAKFVIVAVSKQEPPDKGAYLLNHRQRYDFELEEVKKRMSRILQVKSGRAKPKRCGFCEYCRHSKKLTSVIPYYTLNPAFREEREEEYDEQFAAYMEEAQKTVIYQ